MPLPDPTHPLTAVEKLIFGHDGARHKITGFPLERGYGALSEADQAILHCRAIEEEYGKEAADAMRRKLAAPNLHETKEAPLIIRPTRGAILAAQA